MSTTHAMVALANTCATTLPSTRTLIYTAAKPRGPVLENTFSEAVAILTEKQDFVSSKFWGLVRLHWPRMVSGGMGLPARMAARLRTCLKHPAHLMRVQTQMVVFLATPEGAKTMTAITERKPAPSTSTPDTIPTANLTAVLAAFNAANLASNYIERGNFAAARRKLVQALASIGQLQAGG